MGSKANEIKMAYANVNKLTMHDTQVTYFRKRRLDFITTKIIHEKTTRYYMTFYTYD